MIDSTKPIDDATPLDDISGLKLPNDKSYSLKEVHVLEANNIATRIHHRAVQMHPFQNANGRWSRILTNIYLRQNGSIPVKWQEDLLSSENPKRDEYIKALKMADNGDYKDLIEIHKVTY